VSFMGELSDIGAADLLYLLALRRQTGKLAIATGGEEVSLYLDRGQLVLVTSTNPNLRLGRMLVSLGILDGSRLKEALQLQEQLGRGMPLGRLLLEYDFISERQLLACVEEQCIQILSRVISADQGVFVFHVSATVPSGTEVVPLNADRIVLEATQRTDELVRLRALLPHADTPIRLTAIADELADTMSDDEVTVAASIHSGAITVADVRISTGLDETALLHALLGMLQKGLVVAVEPALSAS
jgi:hypothetical protein